jgi:signal transduction histidine kinase
MRRVNSSVWRIVALHGVAIAAVSVILPLILTYRLHATADRYEHQLLRARLGLISHALRADRPGPMALPPRVLEKVRGDGSFSFQVADGSGRTLLASEQPPPPLPPAGPVQTETFFRAGSAQGAYAVLAKPLQVGDTPLVVEVIHNLDDPSVFVDDVVATFLSQLGWQIAAVLAALFVLDLIVVRAALEPIQRASHDAQGIDTARLDARISERGLPSEIRPLVAAINKALDRLERGFRLQRNFTADVAHELRTPLAIMRLRIGTLADAQAAEALRGDLEVMTRAVDQLLSLAELEAAPADEAAADLGGVAEQVVRHLAPAAIARRRELALSATPGPQMVKAPSGAVFLALRNLVENALHHTPEGSVVEVRVKPGGAVHVLDAGPGVPEADRELIFERFWRRDRQGGGGVGLGLAIVARIAASYGGGVGVDEAPGGGADFSLRFPPVSH